MWGVLWGLEGFFGGFQDGLGGPGEGSGEYFGRLVDAGLTPKKGPEPFRVPVKDNWLI